MNMRDRIAEIVKDCLFRASNKEKASQVASDKILSLICGGWEVVEECNCRAEICDILKYGNVPQCDCPYCQGSGTITRQATWKEVEEALNSLFNYTHIQNARRDGYGHNAFRLKSGGSLRRKQ